MILKQRIQQRLETFHNSGDFLRHVFRKVEKIYVELYSLKERFNEMKIEMDTENENQLKRIRKPPLLLGQEKSLAAKVKNKSLFDKSRFSKIFLTQNLRYFFTF